MKRFALALAFPIVVLFALTMTNALHHGETLDLEIEGYDPRDFLSGHYLTYIVKYGTETTCPQEASAGFVCLRPGRSFHLERPATCERSISGRCENGKFSAGIERYYIPERHAAELDRLARDHRVAIRVVVSSSGQARVKALLVDGKEW